MIIGRRGAGCWASLNDGNGAFGLGSVNLVIHDFGTAQAWQGDKHPRFVADPHGGTSRGECHLVRRCWGVLHAQQRYFPTQPKVDGFEAPALGFVVYLTGDGSADIIGFLGKPDIRLVCKVLTEDFSVEEGGRWTRLCLGWPTWDKRKLKHGYSQPQFIHNTVSFSCTKNYCSISFVGYLYLSHRDSSFTKMLYVNKKYEICCTCKLEPTIKMRAKFTSKAISNLPFRFPEIF